MGEEACRLTEKPRKAQTFRRILCLLLILALLAITLAKELARSSDAYSVEVATLATQTQTDTLTGYVFRDEVAPSSTNNGPIRYLIGEGETVRAGTVLAEVFRDDTGTDKRERAAALYAEIAVLEAALEKETDWKTDYLTDYPTLMQSLSAGAYASAAAQSNDLAAVLGGRVCDKTQAADALRARIDALQAEIDELVIHTNDPAPVPAAMDGVFYHTADGFEQTFGTEAAATLTPEGLATLLSTRAEPNKGVGKLVKNGKWFLAVPVSKELASTYTASTAYTLLFESGALSMTLEKITPSEDEAEALLLFAADTLPAFLSCSRAQRVAVVKQTLTGLSLPACALTEEGAVYVIRDGVARLCPVTLLQANEGCALILPEQGEGKLGEGDRVVVSARQLFDGKVLE